MFAYQLDLSSQRFGELLAQVQSKPRAFLGVLGPCTHLAKSREELRLVFATDADAGILHADLERSAAVFLAPFRP